MTGETFFQLHYHLTGTERLFDLAQGIAARRRWLKKHDARCRSFTWYARGLLRRGIAFLILAAVLGAMTALLKDALKPNLVQTLEHSPALIHGGPFANIAHGCNSVTATRMALKLGDYAVTEAGFAADLGAEKFFDIKCRLSGLRPSAVVIVATVRALKYHGGVPKAELNREDLSALEKGLPNLLHHVGTIRNTFHLPCVVAVNAFPTDTAEELRLVQERCRELGVNAVLSEVWAKGGEGGRDLAREVVRLCDQPRLEEFTFAYPDNTSLIYKLNSIVGRVYGGSQAVLTPAAQKQLKRLTELGFGDLPVCMAKTQYSLSDDPALPGAPRDFTVTVRSLKVSAGAGFIVAYTGDIMTMPGLPRVCLLYTSPSPRD